jgi:hypothetical protein
MKLQDHLNSTDIEMTELQVKAFFLGMLCAEKIPSPSQAVDEFLSDFPELRSVLTVPLKETYEQLRQNLRLELEAMFPTENDITIFIETSKEQLDFFLTGMSLAGTNTEDCKDKELAGFIDELEDTVEDMDDFLADSEATAEDGEDFKKFLLDLWNEFAVSKTA